MIGITAEVDFDFIRPSMSPGPSITTQIKSIGQAQAPKKKKKETKRRNLNIKRACDRPVNPDFTRVASASNQVLFCQIICPDPVSLIYKYFSSACTFFAYRLINQSHRENHFAQSRPRPARRLAKPGLTHRGLAPLTDSPNTDSLIVNLSSWTLHARGLVLLQISIKQKLLQY